ncbi:hypothetical protein C4588_00650 [Candidatus Parcubacteria bacterium]|nr:MAG: hypothetical protein C4588_00650 [Candidatus Parcubacteria bacterium]
MIKKESSILRGRFYIPFKPAESIKWIKLPLWKVVAINVGNIPGKPILLTRLTDKHCMMVSFKELDNDFNDSLHVEEYYKQYGFKYLEKTDEYITLSKNIP